MAEAAPRALCVVRHAQSSIQRVDQKHLAGCHANKDIEELHQSVSCS